MLSFVERAFVLEPAGWFMMIILAGAGYWLIMQTLDDNGSALLGTPILIAGAAFGQLGVRELGIQLAPEKSVNMAIGMAGGMFASALVLVAVLWTWGKMAKR